MRIAILDTMFNTTGCTLDWLEATIRRARRGGLIRDSNGRWRVVVIQVIQIGVTENDMGQANVGKVYSKNLDLRLGGHIAYYPNPSPPNLVA
ncbi:hypothetical protein L195_g050378 [Trifolium pratense]|uniref:Uncharacterized protein n=1 Tax=Trifolium pratense TaxID=57577 RepID=A0A2K3JTM7_TRIPR|nr:hypothetical protein L195_g050378 [Trifolium pratense]